MVVLIILLQNFCNWIYWWLWLENQIRFL